jgi:hypothetical protein
MYLNISFKATAIARVVASVVTTTTALTFCLVSAVSAQVVTEPRLPQSALDQGVQFKSSFSEYVPYSALETLPESLTQNSELKLCPKSVKLAGYATKR